MSPDISETLRAHIREQAGNQCGYCLSQQKYLYASLEIDHIIPQAAGGSDDEANLWLACRTCNSYKGSQTQGIDPQTGQRALLFNPRLQSWRDHFEWSGDGAQALGISPVGRATIVALQLNNARAIATRREWVKVGWHPPT